MIDVGASSVVRRPGAVQIAVIEMMQMLDSGMPIPWLRWFGLVVLWQIYPGEGGVCYVHLVRSSDAFDSAEGLKRKDNRGT
jgi:hypothetical protein